MTIEQSIISTALTRPHLIKGADINTNYFENYQLAQVWSEIEQKVTNNELVDYLTIQQDLNEKTGQDWSVFLGRIIKDSIPAKTQETFDGWCESLLTNHRKSSAIAACEALIQNIGVDSQNQIDACIRDLMALSAESKKYDHNMKEALTGAINLMEKAWDSGGLVGNDTGLKELNDNLGGFHDSDLIIIGARPAMGKTALAINMMLNSRAGFISSEQSADQIGMRFMSLKSGVPLHELRLGKYHENTHALITAASQQLMANDIYVNDRGGINILEVQRQAREWKQKHDIECLFVDYIQKINPARSRSSKQQEVEEVAIGLKNLAKELNIPVIALAQVNRNCEARTDKRPMASDIKDCGTIEQEADIIMMLYRDEVYNEDSNDKGVAELLIEKNRSGPIGCLKVGFDKQTVKFHDLDYGF